MTANSEAEARVSGRRSLCLHQVGNKLWDTAERRVRWLLRSGWLAYISS